MLLSSLRHIHGRRRDLARELRVFADFALWEETCVPSYCHPNLAAAWLSWWRLYAAVAVARRHADLERVLDFGASVGELRRLLPLACDYNFIEQNDLAAGYLLAQFPDATRQTLDSLPSGGSCCVFALDSLEHNRDYPELLRKLTDALAPTGILILSGPTESRLYRLGRRMVGFDAHYHETNIHAIETVAREYLEPLEIRNLPPALPLFRLSAWRVRRARAPDR